MNTKIKRFYLDVDVVPGENGFTIELDKRPIKSPGGQVLHLPHERMADLLAMEWQKQEAFIDRATMPLMQFAGVVSDNIIPNPDEARVEILKYAHSDLLCYRVNDPDRLVERQEQLWGPVLARFASELDIEFKNSIGIQYVEQDKLAMSRFSTLVEPLVGYELGAAHLVTVMTGSAALAIALFRKWLTFEQVWELAHLDEDFQAEQWGTDDEAIERRQRRYGELSAAVLIFDH